MQCGAKEFSRVSGYKGHTRPTADDRRGSHLLHASRKCDTSDPTLRSQGGAGVQAPKPHPRGRGPLLGGLVCTGSLPAPRRCYGRLGEAASSGAFYESGQGRPGPTGGQGAPSGRNRCARAAHPPLPPPGPTFTCSGGSRVRGGRLRPGRPTPRGRPNSPDARTDGPTDALGRRRRASRPPAEGPGTGPNGGAKAAREGAIARSGLTGKESSAGDPAATLARYPCDARSSRPPALPRGFWSLPLAVLLAPPPPPSGLSGQPERRRPWRKGFRRGCGGGGAGGPARGAPGAADHGAPE